jgi:hypothetical protein
VFLVRSISSVVLRSTYRDADTVDTEITQTKNARAIGDDTNLRILARPVSEHSTNGLSLLDRDVQSLRASVNARVLQADITDCGGIDEGHELADVVDEETIEKVGILVLESGQVKVLVDRCLAGLNHLHGSGALGLEALHGVGEETSEVLGSAFLGCEGKSLVPERFSDNLVAGSIGLVDIFRCSVLLDLGIVVLDVATVLIKGGHLDLLFDLGKVDGGHWIGICKSSWG